MWFPLYATKLNSTAANPVCDNYKAMFMLLSSLTLCGPIHISCLMVCARFSHDFKTFHAEARPPETKLPWWSLAITITSKLRRKKNLVLVVSSSSSNSHCLTQTPTAYVHSILDSSWSVMDDTIVTSHSKTS